MYKAGATGIGFVVAINHKFQSSSLTHTHSHSITPISFTTPFSHSHAHTFTMVAASNNSDDPSITVFGATGIQGGSVVRHLLASDKSYRIRAVTRDSTKPAAQKLTEQGVEVVQAELGNQDEVEKAVKGQDFVFVSLPCLPCLHHVLDGRFSSHSSLTLLSISRPSPTFGNTVVKRKSPTVVDSWTSSNLPGSRRSSGLVLNPLARFPMESTPRLSISIAKCVA